MLYFVGSLHVLKFEFLKFRILEMLNFHPCITGTGESADSLYTLALLKSLLPVLPHNSVKSACETILRVMTISNVVIITLID